MDEISILRRALLIAAVESMVSDYQVQIARWKSEAEAQLKQESK